MNMELDFGSIRPANMEEFDHMIILTIKEQIKKMVFVMVWI
jgi:hypothetical protein